MLDGQPHHLVVGSSLGHDPLCRGDVRLGAVETWLANSLVTMPLRNIRQIKAMTKEPGTFS
jgi:hypothetical protein